MAIRFSGAISDYVGLSTDTKPLLQDDGKFIPAGSRFFESDTGADYRFDGSAWGQAGREPVLTKLILEKLDEVLTELQRLNGHLSVGSDATSKEALEMARG